MAKEKTVQQITSEELDQLKAAVSALNAMQMQIGGLEAYKHDLLDKMKVLTSDLQSVQKELETAYGSVNIDLQTGNISDVPNNS